MLQELDQVAIRIGQIVEMSRRLLAERNELLSRLDASTQEGSTLRQQLTSQEAKVAELTTSLSTQTEGVKVENDNLRQQVEELTSRVNTLEAQLNKAQQELSLWREKSQSVRNRVAHILENLPNNAI
ncbi:hypothetical protein V757_04665 [Pelistega indica]|uniref:Uncharacterized protein n=1 Tax=Pelistega indica TaxID=1414851 RepID=V8G9M0_9BURK|nr:MULTISPECIES: hypothetical protein [Pelistega]ETD72402.1 hypothetical protein V757_04665 [Pelistega indica]